MSDYVHQKVVRLPFPQEILDKFETKDPWDCEDYLKGLLGELWEYGKACHFKIECTDKAYYIDWVYYHTYAEESGDYGFARALTQNELTVIKPYFDKLKVKYNDEDLRVVDYCYYNCSEAPDYYNILPDDTDDSALFIR